MDLREMLLRAVEAEEVEAVAFPTPAWPDLNGKLFVRPPTAAERSVVNQECSDNPDNPNRYARWAVRCLCDERGVDMFRDRKSYERDVATLGEDLTGTVEAIAAKAFELGAMTKAEQDKIEKNSETTPTCSSATSSPGTSGSPTLTDSSPA